MFRFAVESHPDSSQKAAEFSVEIVMDVSVSLLQPPPSPPCSLRLVIINTTTMTQSS